MGTRVTDIVEGLVTPILDQKELELVDIEFVKEGSNWFLRVFIDKEGGIDIDDCGSVSEQLSKRLDEVDPISDPYFLEVSSPGIERPLKKPKDFVWAQGKMVSIKTLVPIEEMKVFEGTLASFDGSVITVEEGPNVYHIPLEQVESARLSIVF
jgi:ribosome maturation factor RimP